MIATSAIVFVTLAGSVSREVAGFDWPPYLPALIALAGVIALHPRVLGGAVNLARRTAKKRIDRS
ncbi:MAG: hypothetical protein M5R36_03535 [Deltaproteobacteria bacterium]|nr:hypothetical protein [Deltaproteobacteria bacterium]